jgi:prepilin-type N-terminal cleavage/methylation domain-containing protein
MILLVFKGVFLLKKIKLRAFTLIELMAVVLIIGILSTITVSAINYSIKNAKEKLYAEQIGRLEFGVSSWSTENTDLLPIDGTGIVFFSVDRLKDEGIVDSELIIDPRTNEELTGCMTIVYNETYKQYEYKYEELSCENVSGAYLPTITVVNGLNQFLEVNEEYPFPAATAVDYTGRSVAVTGPIIRNSSNQIVTTIDSSIVGSTYTLSYSSTDLNLDLTKVDNVTLTIRDTVAPTITCGTSSVSYSVTHPAGDVFSAPTCVVKDNSCGTNGTTTTVNGCSSTLTPSIDTIGLTDTIPGTYPITYTATDSSLNTKVFTVTVVVIDTTPPVVVANNSSSDWYASRTATVTATDNVAVSEIRYQWNINGMDGACTTGGTVVTNGTALTVPAGSNRLYLCARDTSSYVGIWDSGADRYRVDGSNPTVTFGTNGDTVWRASNNTTVTVSDSESGVDNATLEYQWTTNTSTPTEASFITSFINGATITTPAGVSGTYYLWILGKDNANNTVITRSNVFNIDNNNPTISANNASSTWFTSRTTTVSAADALSGLAAVRYAWNSNTLLSDCTGGTATSNAAVLTVPAGSNRLYMCSKDNTGNIATYDSGSDQFRVDTGLPTISANNASSTWFTSRTTTVSAADAVSGLATVRYAWNSNTLLSDCTGGTATSNAAVLTVPTGSNRLYMCSKDIAGNVGTYDSGVNQFRVDTIVPTVPTITVNEAWTNAASVAGTIAGSVDTESGVAYYEHSMSGATTLGWTNGASFSVTAAGSTTITVRAIDGVGRVSSTTSKTVNIDRTSPVLTWSVNGSTTYRKSQCTTPTYSDAGGSGVATAFYVWSSSTGSIPGTYEMPSGTSRCYNSTSSTIRITGQVCDNAGNCTRVYTNPFYVDVTAPTLPTILCGYTYSGSLSRYQYYYTYGTDADSGLASGTITSPYGNHTGSVTTSGTMSGRIRTPAITGGTTLVTSQMMSQVTLTDRSLTGGNVYNPSGSTWTITCTSCVSGTNCP